MEEEHIIDRINGTIVFIYRYRSSLKIPIFKDNTKCTDERGYDEINDGDDIVIGNVSSDKYKVTMYSNEDHYIPY